MLGFGYDFCGATRESGAGHPYGEIEPRYIDVAILRWQQLTKLEAILEGDGRSFEEIKRARAKANDSPSAVLSRRRRSRFV